MRNIKSGLLAFSLLTFTTFLALDTNAQALYTPGAQVPLPKENEVITSFGHPIKKQLPARKFNFLVWNLHKGADDPFKLDYLTLAFGRDIIMAEEIYLDDNMMGVFHHFPYMLHTTATSFFSGKEKIRTGVANISPVKPTLTKFLKTETTEPVVNSPKVALITTYPIRFSKKQLTVVNIHGINFVSTKSFRHELNRIYETIKNIPSPLVFAGDFNTWNQDRLNILAEYCKKLGLNQAEFFPDERMRFNGHPLDHFLYTNDLKITSAQVDGSYQGSDHKPLEVQVEYIDQENKKEFDLYYQELLATQ